MNIHYIKDKKKSQKNPIRHNKTFKDEDTEKIFIQIILIIIKKIKKYKL